MDYKNLGYICLVLLKPVSKLHPWLRKRRLPAPLLRAAATVAFAEAAQAARSEVWLFRMNGERRGDAPQTPCPCGLRGILRQVLTIPAFILHGKFTRIYLVLQTGDLKKCSIPFLRTSSSKFRDQ
jgi:hypothetical protein